MAAGVVYGTVAGIVLIVVLLLFLLIASRVLSVIPGPIWVEYTIIGVVLILTGALLWKKRAQRP